MVVQGHQCSKKKIDIYMNPDSNHDGPHVLRMDQAHIPKVALQWTPHGRKTTWCQTAMAEISEVKLSCSEVPHVIQNRNKWKGTLYLISHKG